MKKPYILIGGAGKNSELSAAMIDCLLKNNFQIGIITKPDNADYFYATDQVELFFGDLLDNSFIQQTIQSIIDRNHLIHAYIHNAGTLFKVPFLETHLNTFQDSLNRNFLSAISTTQSLIKDALARNYEQHIIFLGATSSMRGAAEFSPFSSAKFALRGFAQSLAREFSSKGIHICHVTVDGIIVGKRASEFFKKTPSECIQANDMANLLLSLIQQPKSTWTQEIDVRPSGAKF